MIEEVAVLKWALIGAGCFAMLVIGLAVTGGPQNPPKLDVAQAKDVFDRYPHWQRSIFKSQEVALDPGLARKHSDKFAPPRTLAGDPYMVWQPRRREDVQIEIGIGQLAR